MSDTDMLDNPRGENRVGLVLDFVTKYHNGTIPEDEIVKFLRGEPTAGSKFWFTEGATTSFDVPGRWYESESEQRVGAKIVRREGIAYTKHAFPEKDCVRSGGLELLPLRRAATDAEIHRKIFEDDPVRLAIALSDFYAALAAREKDCKSTVGIVGYVGVQSSLWVLEAHWKIEPGTGEGWYITSANAFNKDRIKLKRPKGTEIVRRRFWC